MTPMENQRTICNHMLQLQNINPNFNLNEGNMNKQMLELQNINPNLNPK